MSPRKNSLRSVAELAGVSTAAVSYALNGEPGVGKEKREKILKLANKLGYRPSLAAKCLKSKKIHDIGFLVFESYDSEFIANPFFAEMMVYFIEICKSVGIGFQMEWFDISRPGNELPQMFTSGLVGGIITAGFLGEKLKRFSEKELGIPVVNIYEDGKYSVRVDACEGTSMLVRALAANGHRKIGYVDCSHQYDIFASSYRGFRMALDEVGIEFNENYISEMPVDNDFVGHVRKAVDQIYFRNAEKPTVIISSGSNLTHGIVAYLLKNGIRIPEDLSIVTRYTIRRDMMFNYPQVSALEINLNSLIANAVELLRSVMSGRDLTSKKILLMPEFIHRDTDRILESKSNGEV